MYSLNTLTLIGVVCMASVISVIHVAGVIHMQIQFLVLWLSSVRSRIFYHYSNLSP